VTQSVDPEFKSATARKKKEIIWKSSKPVTVRGQWDAYITQTKPAAPNGLLCYNDTERTRNCVPPGHLIRNNRKHLVPFLKGCRCTPYSDILVSDMLDPIRL
jgi:hypothetical protein